MNGPLAALLGAALFVAPARAQMQVKNPDTLTYLTISDADSMDPAWSYDTASQLVILNVYEPLFWFDGGSLTKLVPLLAAKVPSKGNGLISRDGRVYRIPIRKGVKFQDGVPLTPEDVRYSLVRFMLQDRDAGPSSLLLQPLLGYNATREGGVLKPGVFQDALKAVRVEGGDVVLTLPKPYAPLLSILASWAPIVSKAWAVKNGDWDGTEATWKKWNNPDKESSPFYERADGTGPFILDRWDRKNLQIVLRRNPSYWRKPAALARVVIRGVNEFGTRKLELQAGDADSIYATAPQRSQVENLAGVHLIDDLPAVELNPIVYFTFKINTAGNPNVGSGKLDGDGIPPDFFSDVDVRKGFAYSVDYAGYVRDVKRGHATQATGCIPLSLPGHNPKQKTYSFDPKQAEAHFRKAWGGQVWAKGFRFTLLYNEGNQERETVALMIKRNVENLNAKFQVDVRPVEWPTFLDQYRASKLPIFMMGWQADFPDPHNFAYVLMDSHGDYPATQHYSNPEADRLVERAIAETDAEKRKELYYKLQALEYDDVPHLVIDDSTRFRTDRTWVHGYVHNPIFPDAPYGAYFYTIWKSLPGRKGGGR